MHHDPLSPQSAQGDSGPLVSPPVMSDDALARRRVLLKGLSRSSAALAMAAPISTLAAPTILDGTRLCTVSGVQSIVGSHRTDATVCKGYKPGFYATLSNWPNFRPRPPNVFNTVDGIRFTQTSSFGAVFGGSSTNTLLRILTDAPSSDEAVWLTALLNAIKKPTGFNFPYTPSEVRAFYGGQQAAKAFDFFKNYMQTAG